ncbi:ABC transporter ATP-binding protein [Elusimicrobiota bacterium]
MLLSLQNITKTYKTNERVFLPSFSTFTDARQDKAGFLKTLLMPSLNEICKVWKEAPGTKTHKMMNILMKEEESQVIAVRGVSLEFAEGDFAAIAGPSGSGKSTLLNIMGTLEEPTTGRMFFNGKDMYLAGEDEKAGFRLKTLGFIFQAFNLIPVLSAYENVEYPLILKGLVGSERRSLVEEALRFVGLSDCMQRKPSKLSGGQQQRVAIARAIAAGPKLILADEPTANLDSKTAMEVVRLMERINKETGTTFIFSSHDDLILSIAQRVIKLRDGKIIGGPRTPKHRDALK